MGACTLEHKINSHWIAMLSHYNEMIDMSLSNCNTTEMENYSLRETNRIYFRSDWKDEHLNSYKMIKGKNIVLKASTHASIHTHTHAHTHTTNNNDKHAYKYKQTKHKNRQIPHIQYIYCKRSLNSLDSCPSLKQVTGTSGCLVPIRYF